MLSLSSLSSLNTDIVQESEIYVSQARSTNCIWTIWQDLLWWLARSCFLLELGLSRTMAHYWSGSVSVPCNLQCCVSRYLWALLVSSSPHYWTLQLGLVWQSLSYIDQWEDKTEKLDQWKERCLNWPNQGLYTVYTAPVMVNLLISLLIGPTFLSYLLIGR